MITALKPGIPQNLKLIKRSESAITFQWESPVDNGGLELIGYKVYVAEGSGPYLEVSTAPTRLNPTIITHTQTGMIAGVGYKFKVSAYNAMGEGLMTESIYVIAADMPQSPVNSPSVLEYTQTSITIQIETIPDPSNGGSPVTGYIIMIDDGLGGDFVQVQDSLDMSLTISNLRSGRTYRIKYAGRNIVYDQNNMYECDHIQWSESTVVLTALRPEPPQNLQQDPILKYKTAIVVRWTPSPEDNGSPLIAHILSITDLTDSQAGAILFTLPSSAFDYTFTGLVPGH